MNSDISIILVALGFNLFDLVSGIIGAVKNKDIDSSKLRDGMFKKVGFIFCYVLAYLIDTYGGMIGFNLNVSVLPIIVSYSILTEISSIIENIAVINPDLVPNKILELMHISDIDKE